jgi:uncharacterized membrane protein YadS
MQFQKQNTSLATSQQKKFEKSRVTLFLISFWKRVTFSTAHLVTTQNIKFLRQLFKFLLIFPFSVIFQKKIIHIFFIFYFYLQNDEKFLGKYESQS